MEEIRCVKCNKLLAKWLSETNLLVDKKVEFEAQLKEFKFTSKTIFEIKCPRCGEMNTK